MMPAVTSDPTLGSITTSTGSTAAKPAAADDNRAAKEAPRAVPPMAVQELIRDLSRAQAADADAAADVDAAEEADAARAAEDAEVARAADAADAERAAEEVDSARASANAEDAAGAKAEMAAGQREEAMTTEAPQSSTSEDVEGPRDTPLTVKDPDEDPSQPGDSQRLEAELEIVRRGPSLPEILDTSA
ncbi:MAG: hypothetical protein AAGA32_06255 [Pseudomonadota bacterium]